MSAKKSVLIAAPSSGSGKTVLALALLRCFKEKGLDIASAKAGPDYIDPGFHAIASGRQSVNLDPWAMESDRLHSLALAQEGSHLLVEAMMGLFDGAANGTGSAAELAKGLNAPVVLVVDAAKQSHSIAALVHGFRDHDAQVNFAGVILNKVGSPRHEAMLRQAIASIRVSVLGCIPRDKTLELPERHLGLVQAGETKEIEAFIAQAAKLVSENCDLDALQNCFGSMTQSDAKAKRMPPLGNHIAIAKDEAFSFIYPHLLADWRSQGAEISFFSPLVDEGPNINADAVYLPGGYPELHAEKLASAEKFKAGIKKAATGGRLIYGECGGYMVLGDGLIDADGKPHAMAGLLRLKTSFQKRKLHLGYRKLTCDDFALGTSFKAHEFHYTSAIREEGNPLFDANDALDERLGSQGLREGRIMGSYMHLIDRID